MPSFLSSLANKAQSAYEQSPISAQVSQLQSKLNHGIEGTQAQSNAAQGNQTTGLRGNIVHQFRNLQLQYASVDPVQRIITSEKSVSLDFENISKDAKSQSKEFYMWGQASHGEDINDVTDRLAYLNFIHGSLALSLASELNTSRAAFKTLRNAERALEPRRKERALLQNQIGVLEHEQKKRNEKQIEVLRDQLEKMEKEDSKAEAEIHVLKRKAVAETERAKWAALREYGEKLVLLAESSGPIISALPQDVPTDAQPYKGKEVTAQTRATLQHMLDNYKPGTIGHAFQPHAEDLDRADSRSFGVTHAVELSGIESPALPGQGKASMEQTMHNMPPPAHPNVAKDTTTRTAPSSSTFPQAATVSSPPINPANLNTMPTPLPAKQPSVDTNTNTSTSPDAVSIPAAKVDAPPSTVSHASLDMPSPEMGSAPIKAFEPTLAETGKPITGHGDGPASGSLKDLKSPTGKSTFIPPSAAPMPVPVSLKPGSPFPSTSTATAAAPVPGASASAGAGAFPSAEEEKARLRKEVEGENKPKTAEEEKKELEQRERDRLMQDMAAQQADAETKGDEAMPPPAYQDNV